MRTSATSRTSKVLRAGGSSTRVIGPNTDKVERIGIKPAWVDASMEQPEKRKTRYWLGTGAPAIVILLIFAASVAFCIQTANVNSDVNRQALLGEKCTATDNKGCTGSGAGADALAAGNTDGKPTSATGLLQLHGDDAEVDYLEDDDKRARYRCNTNQIRGPAWGIDGGPNAIHRCIAAGKCVTGGAECTSDDDCTSGKCTKDGAAYTAGTNDVVSCLAAPKVEMKNLYLVQKATCTIAAVDTYDQTGVNVGTDVTSPFDALSNTDLSRPCGSGGQCDVGEVCQQVRIDKPQSQIDTTDVRRLSRKHHHRHRGGKRVRGKKKHTRDHYESPMTQDEKDTVKDLKITNGERLFDHLYGRTVGIQLTQSQLGPAVGVAVSSGVLLVIMLGFAWVYFRRGQPSRVAPLEAGKPGEGNKLMFFHKNLAPNWAGFLAGLFNLMCGVLYLSAAFLFLRAGQNDNWDQDHPMRDVWVDAGCYYDAGLFSGAPTDDHVTIDAFAGKGWIARAIFYTTGFLFIWMRVIVGADMFEPTRGLDI